MGRHNSHKKQVRSERAKIKLKDSKTKFLPKGQNVTDASFKIKPIILPEQLKTHAASAIVSKRNISIKALLDRLDHHNKGIKEDTCDQLKQTIEDDVHGVLSEYLPVLLKRLCPLILHEIHSVRQKVLKTIDAILAKSAPSGTLTPFYPILISFLRSSLTHINRSIREDSLLYLDLLLHHLPRMLAQNCNTLLPLYLSLMSKQSDGSSIEKSTSSPRKIMKVFGDNDKQQQQVLNVDLGSNMTSVNWRIKVLGRLFGFLEAIAKIGGDNAKNAHCNAGCDVENNVMHVSENKAYPLIICNFSNSSEKLYNYTKNNNEDIISSIRNNIQSILRILYDIWAEVAPAADKNNFGNSTEDTILSAETAEILNVILKNMFLLWHTFQNLSTIPSFDKNVTDKFFDNLLNQFPFHKRTPSQHKKIGQSGDDQRCSQENLILCYIFAVMNPRLVTVNKIGFGRKIADYLNTCLIYRNVKRNNMTYLTKCLSVIFKKNAVHWQKANNVNMHELLTNTIDFHITTTFNKELFNVLCDLIQDKSLGSVPAYEIFLSNIPTLLWKNEVSAETIDKIHWISIKKNQVFCTSLLDCMPDVLNILPSMRVIDSPHKLLNPKLKILHMFENCPEINDVHLEFFRAFVNNANERNEYTIYVENFILHK